jgi:hypothetical protein
MYAILFITNDNQQGCIMDGPAPALFADDISAYKFIEETMLQTEHPKMMWIRRIHADS